MNEINIVVIEPFKNPIMTTVKNELEDLQNIIGGYMEAIVVQERKGLVLVCNEDGKNLGFVPNIRLSNDVIVGTCFFVRVDGSEFTSAWDDDLEWARKQFKGLN